MKFARRFLGFGILAMAGGVFGAPLERDLGRGLGYYRIRELPADLPPAVKARPRALVIDLRFVEAGGDAATQFQRWLADRATRKAPVFLLANSSTAAALLPPAERDPAMAVMVVGAPGGGFRPDIAVSTTPANERRAYDAMTAETPIATLILENAGKVRNDEASLSNDRLAQASADSAADAERPPVRPPFDAALQRAVHLHRALVALKKL